MTEPRHLDSWAAVRTAWADLLECTERTLFVLDADLLALDLEDLAAHERLRACVRRLHPHGLRILTADACALHTRMPRTRALLADFAHVASVRVAAERDQAAMCRAIAIGDGRHLLFRPQFDLARGSLELDAPRACLRHTAQLETIWDASSIANIGAVLGL